MIINRHYDSMRMRFSLVVLVCFLTMSVNNVTAVSQLQTEEVDVKDFGAKGDGKTDDTEAIQKAINSRASQINYGSGNYRVEGVLKLISNQLHVGESARIFRGTKDNINPVVLGSNVSNVTINNVDIEGSVEGRYYKSSAACIRFENSSNISITNLKLSNGTSGIQFAYVDGIKIVNATIVNNLISGISGKANNVLIDDSKIISNGYLAKGQTHEIYFVNSSNGIIRGSEIGQHKDSASSGLFIRYDESDSRSGFDQVKDWHIYNNIFYKNGIAIGSDTGVKVAKRKPPKNIIVENNDFTNSANLQFDEPQDSKSRNNKGIKLFICRVASNYEGYKVGLISENDECRQISQAALLSKRDESKSSIIFKNTIINNENGEVVTFPRTFGGKPSLTITNPTIKGKGKVHSENINSSFILVN